MKVYFDNAATTQLDEHVLQAMLPYLRDSYGNPSSIHSHGREVRVAIEQSRKTVAGLLNVTPGEIIFTSGGTEADNTAIRGAVETFALCHAITSRLEHHAVLHTLEKLNEEGKIKLSWVNFDKYGEIDLQHLDELLRSNDRSLVSLMHGNNEVGNLNDLVAIGEICRKHNALFHSDTVQTMAHFKHDFNTLPLNFAVGSAHKFHGPKGVGFLYINKDCRIKPLVCGGGQERNMRGGTENVTGIVGLAKAMEIAYHEMEDHKKHIENLKARMISKLKEGMPGVQFNGLSSDLDRSLYTVLNVCLPASSMNPLLLFNLDLAGISASGGSACSSGAAQGSHVLSALQTSPECGAVRFSFSRYNTVEEVDFVANKIIKTYAIKV